MSSFTAPNLLAATFIAAGTILPTEAIAYASLPTPLAQEELDLRYVDGRNWIVLDDFDFASQTLERLIHIPCGFTTDFASTPRILWPFLPPTGKYSKAALGHDFLYRTTSFSCSRYAADRTFLEMMSVLGVARPIRYLLYLGVRVGGHHSFKRRT